MASRDFWVDTRIASSTGTPGAPSGRTLPAPRVIHKYPAHYSGGHAVKMLPVSPFDAMGLAQAHIGLMDERRGLKCVVPSFRFQTRDRQSVKLDIHPLD